MPETGFNAVKMPHMKSVTMYIHPKWKSWSNQKDDEQLLQIFLGEAL